MLKSHTSNGGTPQQRLPLVDEMNGPWTHCPDSFAMFPQAASVVHVQLAPPAYTALIHELILEVFNQTRSKDQKIIFSWLSVRAKKGAENTLEEQPYLSDTCKHRAHAWKAIYTFTETLIAPGRIKLNYTAAL